MGATYPTFTAANEPDKVFKRNQNINVMDHNPNKELLIARVDI